MTDVYRRALSLTLLAGIFVLPGCGEAELEITDDENEALLNAGLSSTPFIYDGVTAPALTDPGPDDLPQDTEVIGVICNGTARAYATRSMLGAAAHVVNDTFGDSPISVTFCDRTNCVRVLTVPNDSLQEEIHLQTGGFAGGEMLLRLNETMFPHSSEDIPLEDYEFELTTWKEWKTKHAESKLYDTETAGKSGN